MTRAVTPPAFVEEAVCGQADPEAFFPERGQSAKDAKQVCLACPVRVDCLTWALDNAEHHGVWGGLTEKERLRLRRRRTAA
jgi:WhiB family redox-sensing transcriptional regulator